MEGNEAPTFQSSAPLAIWKSWQTQKEVESFIKGFKYLQLQYSSVCSVRPGLQVPEALRSDADDARDAEIVSAIEHLVNTDLTARALMEPTFPGERSLTRLSHRQRSQMLLLLKFSLKAYALGRGMDEEDSQRV